MSTIQESTIGTSGLDLEFRPMTVASVREDTIEMLLDSNKQWVRSLVKAWTGDPEQSGEHGEVEL